MLKVEVSICLSQLFFVSLQKDNKIMDNLELIQWVKAHCKSKTEVDAIVIPSCLEADKMLVTKLNGVEITVIPIVFDSREFNTINGFSSAMFKAAEKYKDSDDIIVRYVKVEDEDNGDVYAQFHILKSKAKIFKKHMVSTNSTYEFIVESNGDIKDCVKYFNSLGVKGDDGEPISSKRTDYAKDMKDAFRKAENKLYVVVKCCGGMPTLSWSIVGIQHECEKFENIKKVIDSIINC